MYVGPWQELRLSKLIDSVANSAKQPKYGRLLSLPLIPEPLIRLTRRAQPSEPQSGDFQALLGQVSVHQCRAMQ